MNDDNFWAQNEKCRTANCGTPCANISIAVEVLRFEITQSTCVDFTAQRQRSLDITSLSLVARSILIALLIAVSCSAGAAPKSDYLMPVYREEGLSAVYRRIYEKKLFVTAGDVARYVYLPALTGTEESVAVYQVAGAKDRKTPKYMVTSTASFSRLWNCVPGTDRVVPDWRAVSVKRRDAPIPASLALAIHKVWIARLQRIFPPPSSEIRGDSSSQIFSATHSNGSQLRGETYDLGKKNMMLIELAEGLIKYCAASPSGRADIAVTIEKKALAILALEGK